MHLFQLGLLFDPILGTCNLEDSVVCKDGSTPSPATTEKPSTVKPTPPPGNFDCPAGIEFIYMAHPEKCNLFYWCEFGEFGGLSNCGTDLWFSFAQQACVPPAESDCDKEPLPATEEPEPE